MAAVRGSKQYQMVVVPYRPFYKAGVFCICLIAVVGLSWATYHYGLDQGLATKAEVVNEREELQRQLQDSADLVREMRSEIAELKLGGQIDSRANEEVRETVEALQQQIAELNEEIRFYKGVMVPNAEDKGLRVERLNLSGGNDGDRTFSYDLLLTQVVDKHEYVQGSVQITVSGIQNGSQRTVTLEELSGGDTGSIRFRFRYFQNVDGEVTLPVGFQPEQVTVIAQSSGGNAQRLEKSFDWQVIGG